MTKNRIAAAVAVSLSLLTPASAGATTAIIWNETVSDTFNTGAVPEDSHGNVNNWYDTAGGTWSGGTGQLVGTVDENDAWGTYTIFRNLLADTLDQRITIDIADGFDLAAPYLGLVARYQDADNFYLAVPETNAIFVYKVDGGAISTITNFSFGEDVDPAHDYRFDFSAVGSNPTVLTARLTDLTTGRVFGAARASDGTTAMQGEGAAGITTWGTGTAYIDEAHIYEGAEEALAGSGDSTDDPALIESCRDLYALHYESVREETEGRYYALANDIGECADDDLPLPIGIEFMGTLDGRGHTISGIGIDSAMPMLGLFPLLSSATIRDLDLRAGSGEPNVRGFYDVGALAGQSFGTVIENVTSDLDVDATDNQAGGLIGEAYETTFSNVRVTGDVSGYYAVGGLTGYAGGLITIEDSSHEGTISALESAAGGFIGDGYDDGSTVTITGSYHSGDVTSSGEYGGGLMGAANEVTISGSHASGGLVAEGDYAGGLVGYVNGLLQVDTSYATGTVASFGNAGGLFGWLSLGADSYARESYADVDVTSSGDYAGGFAGFFQGTAIPVDDSYALGTVHGDGSYVGGFAGYLDYASVARSYAAGDVEGGSDYVGGFVGRIEESNPTTISDSFAAGAVSLPTADHFGQFAGNFGGSVTFENSFAVGDSFAAPPQYCVALNDMPYPVEVATGGGCSLVGSAEYFQGSGIDEAGYDPTSNWDWETVWHTVSAGFPELRAFSDPEPEAETAAPRRRRSGGHHRSSPREDAAAAAPAETSIAEGFLFTRDLTLGSEGEDVAALQALLVARGYLAMPAGVAPGYFGPLTRAALAAFQLERGIAPAVGYFGPLTRAAVSALAGR